jgi:hypothetical protein
LDYISTLTGLLRMDWNWTEHVEDLVTAAAIIAGGAWALYRFGLYRERFPSMEIENGIKYLGENKEEYLLELYCVVENKGKVRKWVAPLDFELLYLKSDEPFTWDPEMNDEIHFNKVVQENVHYGNRKFWVYPDWYIPFVDGQSKKRFQYLINVPKSCQYLSLNTRFIDFNNKDKAVEHILFLLNREKQTASAQEKPWSEKTLVEKIDEVRKKKTDFYYSQVTLSIDEIKTCSTAAPAVDPQKELQ